MICSVLLLLDYVNSPTSSRARPGGRRPTGGSAASTQVVTHILCVVYKCLPNLYVLIRVARQAYRYLSSNETSRINNLVTTTGKIGNLSSVYRGAVLFVALSIQYFLFGLYESMIRNMEHNLRWSKYRREEVSTALIPVLTFFIGPCFAETSNEALLVETPHCKYV